jgi:hypothetical protein
MTAIAVPAKPTTNGTVVQRLELDTQRVEITIRGLAPLICNRWSEKAKKQMLDKQTKAAKLAKEAKDPDADYRASLYPYPGGGYGFPSVAFKAAAVRAGTYCDMKMTFLRGAFHILGDLVKIEGEPRSREDMVRVGMGTADIRYRAEFPEWSVKLPVIFNARAISIDQVVNLLNLAGFAVGVGEWRPERDGQFGLFEVV